MVILLLNLGAIFAVCRSHVAKISGAKNLTCNGHLLKLLTPSKWCRFFKRASNDMGGFLFLFGEALFFFSNSSILASRTSLSMWRVACVFCHAHSNCKAAYLDGKPVTMQVISQGRFVCRDVRFAPPLLEPLCWPSRRAGLGVLPM